MSKALFAQRRDGRVADPGARRQQVYREPLVEGTRPSSRGSIATAFRKARASPL